MGFKNFLNEVTQIGYQDIKAKNLFGPVYHGTTPENLQNILKKGFYISHEMKRNGYQMAAYGTNSVTPPPPVDHLGFGVYFTTIKSIGKQFNLGTTKGLLPYYLDIPRLETINFGSPNNMMKWWKQHDYNMEPIDKLKKEGIPHDEIISIWKQETENLTNNLKSKYDAVWFKGKGIRRLLDGDQICVFDPKRIYLFNSDFNAENEYHVGDRIKIKEVPVIVTIVGERKTPNNNSPYDEFFNIKSKNYYEVKGLSGNMGYLYQVYFNKLYNIIKNDTKYQDYINNIANGRGISIDQAIGEIASRYTNEVDYLKRNFPESLIEKKIPRGKRL